MAPLPPAAPVNVAAIPGDGHNTISWSPVAGATSYNIYYSTVHDNATKLAGNPISGVASPYVHEPIDNGTTIFYCVTAVGPGGESDDSSIVGATPGVLINMYEFAGPGQLQDFINTNSILQVQIQKITPWEGRWYLFYWGAEPGN